MAPLLPFVSCSPAGCRIACCCVHPPHVTFCCVASHARPLLFVHAIWLSRRISLHRLRLLTRRRLTTGCVVAVLMRRRLCRCNDCDCHPRRSIPSSWRHCPRRHHRQRPSPSSSLSYPVVPLPWSSLLSTSPVAPSPSSSTSQSVAPSPSSSLRRRRRRRPSRRHHNM